MIAHCSGHSLTQFLFSPLLQIGVQEGTKDRCPDSCCHSPPLEPHFAIVTDSVSGPIFEELLPRKQREANIHVNG